MFAWRPDERGMDLELLPACICALAALDLYNSEEYYILYHVSDSGDI